MSDVYYLALLYHMGCTGAVAAQSRLGGGDDINVRRWMSEADFADRPALMRIVVTRLAGQWGPSGLAQGIASLATAGRDMPEALANIAEAAARLSQRLGASPRVTEALSHAYGRWDGEVFTSLPSAEGLSLAARLVHLVHVAQIYHQTGGGQVEGKKFIQTAEPDGVRSRAREALAAEQPRSLAHAVFGFCVGSGVERRARAASARRTIPFGRNRPGACRFRRSGLAFYSRALYWRCAAG